jgi:predicted phage tail protein
MNKLTEINLHGRLGESIGRKKWELKAGSAAEALHAINSQSGQKVRKFFLDNRNGFAKYRVLINGKDVPPSEDIKDCNELTLKRDDLRKIDIIPILEGAGNNDWLGWVGLGLGLIGMGFAQSDFAMMIGMALAMYGAHMLLAEDPPMPEFRSIINPSSDPTALANSYLFNGPVNVMNEGGPVPLGYGRLMVGSQVVMASYDIKYINVDEAGKVI